MSAFVATDTKIRATFNVSQFERMDPWTRNNFASQLRSQLDSLPHWTDEGPFYARILGVGWWDSKQSLLSRLAAARSEALIATRAPGAAPQSVAAAAAEGFAEGVEDGIENLKTWTPTLAIGAGALLVLFVVLKARS